MPRRHSLEDLLDDLFDDVQDAVEGFLEDAREQAIDYSARSIPAPQAAPRPRAAVRQTPPPRTRPAPKRTHYDVLQVTRDADAETVKAAYLSLVQRFHPDRAPADKSKEWEARTKSITEAYTVLKDPAKRKAYDRTL